MVVEVLTWTCTIVFVAIAIITILSIINVIKIKEEFRSKLFYALIVEIVVSGVLVFKRAIVEQPVNIIRITSPTWSDTPLNFKKGTLLFISGFCQKQADVSFKGVVIVKGKKYEIANFKQDDRNIFTATALLPDTLTSVEAKILVKLVSNEKTIFPDSSAILISVR